MQQPPDTFAARSPRRVMLVMMSPSTLYNYLYSMAISSACGLLPVLGGALFLSGAVATALAQTFIGENRRCLTRRLRITGTILMGVLLLFSLVLFSIYPVFSAPPGVWALFTVALALTVRAILGQRLVAAVMNARMGRTAFATLYAALQLVPACVLLPVFFGTMPHTTAWEALGGYGLSVLLEGYAHLRERHDIAASLGPAPVDAETVRQTAQGLYGVHAYGAYRRMHLLILVALQVSLVMVYTFIGITTAEMIAGLALSVGCTIILRELTDLILSRIKRRKPALIPLLLFGLCLWSYGLLLFYRQLGGAADLFASYLTLGLSSGGLSIAVTCLAGLEREMAEVAAYGLHSQTRGYDRVRAVYTEFAILLGQLIALVLLAVLCLPAGIDLATIDFAFVLRSFRPLMVAPPLLLLVASILSVLHFPLNSRHFEKLRRFMAPGGEPNPALARQLDDVVVRRHKNRFGLKIIISLVRPLYYHRVLGRENLQGLEDGTVVLVCNHGELYGPVAANLYIPISFRPWTIDKMMDESEIVRHIYENSMLRQRWLPQRLKLPFTRMLCPLAIWMYKSLEAIPVYRNSPRKLMGTFRQTVEAMQAGDNILLFPEHDQPDAPGQRGYVLEGVGDLYTGFVMIGPALHAKTRKRAVFVPVYASRQLRTLTIGQGVRYDPDAPANDEKLRIVRALVGRMQAMYAVEVREVARRRTARHQRLTARRHLRRSERAELAALTAELEAAARAEAPQAAPTRNADTAHNEEPARCATAAQQPHSAQNGNALQPTDAAQGANAAHTVETAPQANAAFPD